MSSLTEWVWDTNLSTLQPLLRSPGKERIVNLWRAQPCVEMKPQEIMFRSIAYIYNFVNFPERIRME